MLKGYVKKNGQLMNSIALIPQCHFSTAFSGRSTRLSLENISAKLKLVKIWITELFPKSVDEF
jgi:hypothetical protein